MSAEESLDLEDWVVVDEDWWRLPFHHVSWSYRRRHLWSLDGTRATLHPRPPHYQDILFLHKKDAEVEGETVEEHVVALNPALVGVKGTEEAIRRYELDVGIYPLSESYLESSFLFANPLFDGDFDETDFAMAQKRWDDQVRMLLGGIIQRHESDVFSDCEDERKVWNLNLIEQSSSSTSTARTSVSPDVVDLTDSELSAESDPLPSTPHTDKKSYAAVVFDDRRIHSFHEGTVIAPSPSKPLNASALSFIPAVNPPSSSPTPESPTSSYTSPTYEFHFPSLNPQPMASRAGTRSLPPNLEKDEQGFYIEVPSPASAARSHSSTRTATPRRPSAALLPAFLTDSSSSARSRHTSKTREIVDRLRSTITSDTPRKQKKGDTSGLRLSLDAEDSVAPTVEEEKTEEPKEEVPDCTADNSAAIDGWITNIENEANASKAASNKNGWIEGVASKSRPNRRSKAHKRSASSMSAASMSYPPTTPSSTTSSVTTLPSPASSMTSFGSPYTPTGAFPPTAFYPYAGPPYAPCGNTIPMPPPIAQAQAAYMQMQMQARSQAQWQMQMQAQAQTQARMQAVGMVPAYPMYAPPVNVGLHSVGIPPAVPVHPFDPRCKITGTAGIRHA